MCAYQINGISGPYDKLNIDSSIKYARNASANQKDFVISPLRDVNNIQAPVLKFAQDEKSLDENIEKLDKFTKENDAYLASLPPLEYEYRYMPKPINGKIDKKALMGVAYEQMGQKEFSVKDFETNFLDTNKMTAGPLDINQDGKIDVSEYAANILATDMLSKDMTDVTKIDGSINSKGMNAMLTYSTKANAAAAQKLYANIYKTFELAAELDEFDNY